MVSLGEERTLDTEASRENDHVTMKAETRVMEEAKKDPSLQASEEA